MSGNLLVSNYNYVDDIAACEEHFEASDSSWYESTKDRILVLNYEEPGFLISDGGKSMIKLDSRPRLEGNFIKSKDRLYTLNGRAITPPNIHSYKLANEYVIYSTKIKNTILYGAHNYRTNSDSIPIAYSDIKYEGGKFFVRQHFYEKFEQYIPGRTTTEIEEYDNSEALLMEGKYEESLSALEDELAVDSTMYLETKMVLLHDLTECIDVDMQKAIKLVNDVKASNWVHYYNNNKTSEVLNYDISDDKNELKVLNSQYNLILQMADTLDISEWAPYLAERCTKTKNMFECLDSIENDFIASVDYIGKKSIELDEYKKRMAEEQRRREEQRRIEKQQMWAAFGAALAGAVVSTAGAISSNNSTSSRVSSSSSVTSYSNSSYSGSSSSSSSSSSNTETREKQKVMKECVVCHGTGKEPDWNLSEGTGSLTYCSECKRDTNPKHRHIKCKICNGTGQVFDKYK